MEGITRRGFVGAGIGAAAAAAAMGLLNVDAAVAANADGTLVYRGEAQGLRGHIVADVTTDGEHIVDVKIAETTEAPRRVARRAEQQIPARIVEAQSVNVDGVAGATFTSWAIKNAVSQALDTAGVLEAFDVTAPTVELPVPEDAECDVLICGAGASGCMAALATKYSGLNGVNNPDVNVILLEKEDYIGGSMQFCWGWLQSRLPLDDPSNVEAHFDEQYDYWLRGEKSNVADPDFPPNYELNKMILTTIGDTLLKMQSLGCPFDTAGLTGEGAGGPDYDIFSDSNVAIHAIANHFGQFIPENDYWFTNGIDLAEFFERRLRENTDVDLRLNTAGTALVIEDGAVVGMEVEGPAGPYKIRAKKVILAAGDCTRNPEMIAELVPNLAGIVPCCGAGCQGDGVRMCLELGATFSGKELDGQVSWDDRRGIDTDARPNGDCVLVNAQGRRYTSEVYDPAVYPYVYDTLALPEHYGFAILDAAAPSYETVANAPYLQEFLVKAETLEELAEGLGLPVADFVATVEAYNEVAASGADDPDFGVPNDQMHPLTTPPFLGGRIQVQTAGLAAGVNVNADCQLLVNDGSDVVENLYVVGASTFSGGAAWCCQAFAMGRRAAEHAKQAIGIVGSTARGLGDAYEGYR